MFSYDLMDKYPLIYVQQRDYANKFYAYRIVADGLSLISFNSDHFIFSFFIVTTISKSNKLYVIFDNIKECYLSTFHFPYHDGSDTKLEMKNPLKNFFFHLQR